MEILARVVDDGWIARVNRSTTSFLVTLDRISASTAPEKSICVSHHPNKKGAKQQQARTSHEIVIA